MKTLVIYDSNFGNTRSVAETVANQLNGQALSVKDVAEDSLKDVKLLIVGSPINAWRPTTGIRNFLDALAGRQIQGIKAAAFDTRVKIFISGNAAKKISNKLREKGAEIIAEPQAFYVKDNEGPLLEGELESARKWALEIAQKVKSQL